LQIYRDLKIRVCANKSVPLVTFHYFYLCFLCWFIGLYSKKVKTIWDQTFCEMRKKMSLQTWVSSERKLLGKNAKFLFVFFSRNFRISYIAIIFAFCASKQNAKKCKIFAKIAKFSRNYLFFSLASNKSFLKNKKILNK